MDERVVHRVARAQFDLSHPRKDVQFGDEQVGHAVDADGVTEQDSVQPADAARTSGGCAELIPRIRAGAAQALSGFAFDLGGEGSRADARLEGFRHAHHARIARGGDAEPESRQRGGRDGGGTRHERIRPVVNVEQCPLRALGQHGLSLFEGQGEFGGGVVDVERQARGLVQVGFDLRLHFQFGRGEQAQGPVGFEQVSLQTLAKIRREQVGHAKSAACGLVHVGGADAASGRADLAFAARGLVGVIQCAVRGRDEMRGGRDAQALRRDGNPRGAQGGHFFDQRARVDDHAVAHDGGGVRVDDARRHEM